MEVSFRHPLPELQSQGKENMLTHMLALKKLFVFLQFEMIIDSQEAAKIVLNF